MKSHVSCCYSIAESRYITTCIHLLILNSLSLSHTHTLFPSLACFMQLDLQPCWNSGVTDVTIRVRDFGSVRRYSRSAHSSGIVCHPINCINGLSTDTATIVATDAYGREVSTQPTSFPRNYPFYTNEDKCFTGQADVTVLCQLVLAELYTAGKSSTIH